MLTVMEKRRRELGLSAVELGERVGRSHVAIRNLERGVALDAAPDFADALEYELDLPFDVMLWRLAEEPSTD